MSEDSDRSDSFGQAISLDGGLLLAGAPRKHRDVPEVQLVASSGTASEVSGSFLEHVRENRQLPVGLRIGVPAVRWSCVTTSLSNANVLFVKEA